MKEKEVVEETVPFSSENQKFNDISVQSVRSLGNCSYTLSSGCFLQKLEKIGLERFEEKELDHATILEEERRNSSRNAIDTMSFQI